MQHDWMVINVDTKRFSRQEDLLGNPEYMLNVFLIDMQFEPKLLRAIYRFNAHDIRGYNVVVTDQSMDRSRILSGFVRLYQRRYLLNLAVLYVNDGKPAFYTVNPFEMSHLVEVSSSPNETATFEKVFYDKSMHMNGHRVYRFESVGSRQMTRLRSAKQQRIMFEQNQQYSRLIGDYFGVAVENNRWVNGSNGIVDNRMCDASTLVQRYQ